MYVRSSSRLRAPVFLLSFLFFPLLGPDFDCFSAFLSAKACHLIFTDSSCCRLFVNGSSQVLAPICLTGFSLSESELKEEETNKSLWVPPPLSKGFLHLSHFDDAVVYIIWPILLRNTASIPCLDGVSCLTSHAHTHTHTSIQHTYVPTPT